MRATIGRAATCLRARLSRRSPRPRWATKPWPWTAAEAAPDPLFDEEYRAELGASVPDPIEPLNRKFFRFNDGVDQYVLVPVTNAYQFVVPSPVRASIRRVFRNLQSPVHFVNNLLQLRFHDAAETLGGFALNSTAGFGGLFDPGSEVGWDRTRPISVRRSACSASGAGPIWWSRCSARAPCATASETWWTAPSIRSPTCSGWAT